MDIETQSTPGTAAPKSKKRSLLTWILEIAIVAACIALFWMLRGGVYETAIVTSGSMEPTLYKDDHVLVDHRQVLHGHYERGDVILFKPPSAWHDNTDLLTKRIIALPGENWSLKAGKVYINGQALAETYLKEPPDAEEYYYHLGADEYFVMGDNRRNSDDSRYNGPIKDADIIGRMLYIVSPLDRLGAVTHPDYPAALTP